VCEVAADILAAAGLTLSKQKTIAAMKAARAGRVTRSKNLDDLFGELNANT